jgi:hypothetical protein
VNVNQLLNMVMRLFLRKAVNGGINAGMRKMGGAGRGKGTAGAPDDTAAAGQGAQGKQAVRKARQAARAARRMGKM